MQGGWAARRILGEEQEPVSVPFCFLRRPPECPELWPSLARPAHPQPLPLSSWALGYSCRLLCNSIPTCFARSLRTTPPGPLRNLEGSPRLRAELDLTLQPKRASEPLAGVGEPGLESWFQILALPFIDLVVTLGR